MLNKIGDKAFSADGASRSPELDGHTTALVGAAVARSGVAKNDEAPELGRYLIFAYNGHQIKGGWGDLIERIHDKDRAIQYARLIMPVYEHVDIIDSRTGEQCCPARLAQQALAAVRSGQKRPDPA